MEREALERRSVWARAADRMVVRGGQPWFIAFHAIWFAAWIYLNRAGPVGLRFDPFPFPLLSLAVALEAIFLVLLILTCQNRSTLQAEERHHLELQINLLAEHENTKMLQMLKALCAHHWLSAEIRKLQS